MEKDEFYRRDRPNGGFGFVKAAGRELHIALGTIVIHSDLAWKLKIVTPERKKLDTISVICQGSQNEQSRTSSNTVRDI